MPPSNVEAFFLVRERENPLRPLLCRKCLSKKRPGVASRKMNSDITLTLVKGNIHMHLIKQKILIDIFWGLFSSLEGSKRLACPCMIF